MPQSVRLNISSGAKSCPVSVRASTPQANADMWSSIAPDGRTRRCRIGLHGRLTADEARREAKALLGEVAKGEDPAEDRATRRATITVRELCERYIQATRKGLILGKNGGPKKPTTLIRDKSRIDRHILPLLANRRVTELTRADVIRFMRDVATGKTALRGENGQTSRQVHCGRRPRCLQLVQSGSSGEFSPTQSPRG